MTGDKDLDTGIFDDFKDALQYTSVVPVTASVMTS